MNDISERSLSNPVALPAGVQPCLRCDAAEVTSAATSSDGYPGIWVRPPKKGVEPHCGLSRGCLYELIKAGSIRSVSLRKPGALRGIRVIWLPSVFEWIERHIETIRSTPVTTISGTANSL